MTMAHNNCLVLVVFKHLLSSEFPLFGAFGDVSTGDWGTMSNS